MIIGVISFWVIVDFPDDATFLEPLERHVIITRLKNDGQASYRHETYQWRYFWAVYKDWKTWVGMLMYMGVDGALYAFSLFLPSIINELGYTATKAQLLSVAPYAVACLMVLSFPAEVKSDLFGGFCSRQNRSSWNIQYFICSYWMCWIRNARRVSKCSCLLCRDVFGSYWNLPLYFQYHFMGKQ